MNVELDQKVYEEQVVKPLRGAHGELPDDLATRYAVDLSMDGGQLAARVKEITALWNNKARGKNSLAEVYRKFQRAHDDLLGQAGVVLDSPQWWRKYAERRTASAAAEMARLADMVRQGYGPVGFVLPGQISKIEKEYPGLRRAEIVRVLDDAGIVTVAPVPLPQRSGLDQSSYRRLREALAAADVLTIAQLLHPDMAPVRLYPDSAVPGAAVAEFGAEALERRSKNAEREADSPRFRAMKEALGILRTALQHGGDLRQVAVYHILEVAKETRTVGQPAIFVLQRLVKLGLAEPDARLLTASLLATEGSGSPADGAEEVRRLLGDGLLAAARLCAGGLLGDDPDTAAARELVARTQAQVDELLAAARAALAAGDEEGSSRRAHAARELASDDPEVARFAASLPPPPPAGLAAAADGFDVRLSWRPIPGANAGLRYRVVRCVGRPPIEPGDGQTVADVTASTARDTAPPAGRSLVYGVFATSDGRVWSRGVTCDVDVMPPVAEVTMQMNADIARCSWRVHPEAVRVIVRRSVDVPPKGPQDGVPVETTGTAFADSGLAPGMSHCYAITAVYRGDNGAERHSAAAFVSTTAQESPAPVVSLRAEAVPGDDDIPLRVRILWRQKQAADVRIRLARVQCPWPFGDMVSRADLVSYGEELTGELTVRDGRATLVAEVPSGHFFLTPFSFGDNGALVGQDVGLGLTSPVGPVSYERRDTELLLSWQWPPRANAAEVRWAGGSGTGKIRITRGQRQRDGGWARIQAGDERVRVEVRAIEVCPTGDATSWPRVVQVADSERRLSYEVVWKPALPGVGTKRACTVRLAAESPCHGVTIAAVARPGIVRPMSPDDGTEVARWHGDVSLDAAALFQVTVPRTFRKPYWLCCFLIAGDGVLADPAISHMKVE